MSDHERAPQAESVIGHHSPGPWAVDLMAMDRPLAEGTPILAVLAGPEDGFLVGHPPFSDRDRANAALIAAAPDLLAALKHAANLLSDLEYHWHGDMDKFWSPIRAAIAKATMTAQPPAKSENPS